MPCIIQVLLFITHRLIIYSLIYFLINTFFLVNFDFVDANFIFILIFILCLTLVQFGIHSVVSSYACSMVYFIFLKLFYLLRVAFTLHIFIMFIPHCTLKYLLFFLSSCTRNLAHKSQCCKYTLTEPHTPTMHVHTPSTQMPFRARTIEDLKKCFGWSAPHGHSTLPLRWESDWLCNGPPFIRHRHIHHECIGPIYPYVSTWTEKNAGC